jgi:hypothetical protein
MPVGAQHLVNLVSARVLPFLCDVFMYCGSLWLRFSGHL